jgi:hypothetical protein
VYQSLHNIKHLIHLEEGVTKINEEDEMIVESELLIIIQDEDETIQSLSLNELLLMLDIMTDDREFKTFTDLVEWICVNERNSYHGRALLLMGVCGLAPSLCKGTAHDKVVTGQRLKDSEYTGVFDVDLVYPNTVGDAPNTGSQASLGDYLLRRSVAPVRLHRNCLNEYGLLALEKARVEVLSTARVLTPGRKNPWWEYGWFVVMTDSPKRVVRLTMCHLDRSTLRILSSLFLMHSEEEAAIMGMLMSKELAQKITADPECGIINCDAPKWLDFSSVEFTALALYEYAEIHCNRIALTGLVHYLRGILELRRHLIEHDLAHYLRPVHVRYSADYGIKLPVRLGRVGRFTLAAERGHRVKTVWTWASENSRQTLTTAWRKDHATLAYHHAANHLLMSSDYSQ